VLVDIVPPVATTVRRPMMESFRTPAASAGEVAPKAGD
jgi:hypothetical protein